MIILKKRKKSWELYPIGSPKGALNTKRTPEFIGVLKFKRTDDGIDIKRFIVKKDKEDKLYPPSKAISILRSQAVFLADEDKDLEDFLETLNIQVRHTTICQHCVYEANVTIINSSFSYNYHNQKICQSCAEETIKRELKLRGYDKKVFRNFKNILEKTGSLDEVLKMLSPRFDPLANGNLTLFDKIKVHDSDIPKVAMKRLKIPKEFKNVLLKKNKYLLPVQYLAIKEGLLRDENLLVVSATGSGKTLVGELAGVPKALRGKKFLFLTPLVALANQKYRDFKKKYEALGLKVAIKVGMNRIKAKGELKLPDSNISDADIVVGTYEGIDFLLRSGKSDLLKDLGLVLIDEIHTISDEDRGLRLNGLIKRISHIFPSTQIIGLSATIKNPKTLAKDFGMKLVQYSERPVPLERHVVFVRGDVQRRLLMKKLVLREFHTKSSKGFNGQTLIFTNSRRKTHKLANFLSNKGISASAYHAGLSYFKKEKIEKNFSQGKIAAVVTTAALAAGVDFPASQVIFESLLMGNKWISPNEFSQMLGRAGRPTYHDRGVVFLVPEIGSEFDGDSEESIALDLLESDVEDVHVEYDEDGSLEQILADISSKSLNNIKEINEFYKNIPIPINLNIAIDELLDKKTIGMSIVRNKAKFRAKNNSNSKSSKNNSKNSNSNLNNKSKDNVVSKNSNNNFNNKANDKVVSKNLKSSNDEVYATKYGRAVSMSFLSVEDGEMIKQAIQDPYYLSRYVNKPFFRNFIKKLNKTLSKSSKNNKSKNNNYKSNNSKNNNSQNNNSKNRKKSQNKKNSKNNSNLFNKPLIKLSKENINSNMYLKVQNMAMDLELFENAYLSPVVHKQIANAIKMNFSTRLFSESTLDIISSGESIAKLDKKFQEALLKLQIDFLRCNCKERPFCDCLQRGISYYILNERLNRRDPIDISKKLLKEYQIQTYPGDIFSWLDSFVRSLDAIKRVANAFGKRDIANEANNLIRIIEKGK